MPRVTRLSGTLQKQDGLLVETESGGSTYLYTLRRVDDDSDELECVAKTVDGDEADPEVTDTVVEVAEERGFSLA